MENKAAINAEVPGRWRREVARRLKLEWLGDLFRLSRAFGSLNLRKSVWRLRGQTGPCPCQHASDSGRANETVCEEIAGWGHPAMFRRVCPLLRQNERGQWRCSVNAADVRPFWGRAARHAAGLAAILGLTCILGVYGLLHLLGYPVGFMQVAWPPSWSGIRQVRGAALLARAKQAFMDHRAHEGFMYLQESYDLDSSNYATELILAQLWAASEGDYYNHYFRGILQAHPEKRNEVALAWFRPLLIHGDFATMETLAGAQIVNDSAHRASWLNILLQASRRTGHTAAIQRVAADRRLPDYVRQIGAWELQLRHASQAETGTMLTRPLIAFDRPPSFLVCYRIDRLLAAGLAYDAIGQLTRHESALSSVDRAILKLDAYQALGWRALLEDEIDLLLRTEPRTDALGLVCAHLVRHPDKDLIEHVCASVERHPLPPSNDIGGIYAALACAAGAAGDWALMTRMDELFQTCPEAATRGFTLSGLQAFMQGRRPDTTVSLYLEQLPTLPVPVAFAMYESAVKLPDAGQP